jgi:hypothetical protein
MNKIKYPTIKISIFVFLAAFALSTKVDAAPAKRETKKEKLPTNPSDLYVSLGNLCEFIGTYQTDDEGTKNGCSFLPTLSGSLDYYLTPKFALSPQIGLTMPKSGADDNIKRMTFFALANVKYKTNYANLIGGAGFYFTRISGPGGEEELNNGSGTDSFPLPKEAVYSRNFILNLGLGLDFNKEWSGELYSYVFNALKSEDRAFSVGATISYHFGEVL